MSSIWSAPPFYPRYKAGACSRPEVATLDIEGAIMVARGFHVFSDPK